MADTPKCRHCGEGQDAHLADALECADDDGNWIGTFWTPTPEPAPDVWTVDGQGALRRGVHVVRPLGDHRPVKLAPSDAASLRAALARPAEPRAAEDWRSFPDDLRAIVLDDLDRESDSEDVTDAYQTARRLLLSAAEPPPTARPAEPRSDVVEQIEKLQERWTVPTTAGDVPHPYYVPETERDAAVSLMRGLGWTVEVDDGPGDWFADVRAHGRVFVLTHRDGRGFGVSELPTEYGEGPQTVHADHVAAIGRVVELLAVPPTGPTEGES